MELIEVDFEILWNLLNEIQRYRTLTPEEEEIFYKLMKKRYA